MVTLYLFTSLGIFIWDQYPSFNDCNKIKSELFVFLQDYGNSDDLFSIECINLQNKKDK
tara:strand:+ start:1273 stop:1449 length:177 start_codon:yes stop_codon:yes gene_type:complete